MEYEMRNLQATDIFSVVKILNGIGLNNVKEAIDNWSEMKFSGMTKEEVLIHKDESTTFSLVSLEQKTPAELSTIFGEEKANLITKIVDIFN